MKRVLLLPLLLALVAGTGCSTLSNTEKGAAGGAGAGAVVGGAIGKATGSTTKGAIIGAVVGGTAGAVIGRQMDKQAEELEGALGDNADVEVVKDPETGESAGIQVTFDSAILFGFDSSNLSATARENLRALASSLQEYPNTEILVTGHTDAVGSESYNQDLSERRAGAASSYLMSEGVAPSRITTLGKGETEPVATNETDYGRAQNRRVEIAIFASEEYRQELQEGVGR